MTPIGCHSCSETFIPKDRGYNARYCSDTCKRRSQRSRLRKSNPGQLKAARRRSYLRTKSHTDRLEKHRAAAKQYRQKGREWLASYKLSIGCVDCGFRAHAAALQLDHEGPKSIEIADARSSIARLKAEITSGECRVRCANCHSIRTWERKQRDSGKIGRGCE